MDALNYVLKSHCSIVVRGRRTTIRHCGEEIVSYGGGQNSSIVARKFKFGAVPMTDCFQGATRTQLTLMDSRYEWWAWTKGATGTDGVVVVVIVHCRRMNLSVCILCCDGHFLRYHLTDQTFQTMVFCTDNESGCCYCYDASTCTNIVKIFSQRPPPLSGQLDCCSVISTKEGRVSEWDGELSVSGAFEGSTRDRQRGARLRQLWCLDSGRRWLFCHWLKYVV